MGETIFTIPYLGYVLKAIQSRNGIFILLIIIGINIVYLIFSNDEKNKKAKVNKEK